MDYVNAHSEALGFTVEYATLSQYFAALHNESTAWTTTQHGDFLPYTNAVNVEGDLGGSQTWWVGEFSSWPVSHPRLEILEVCVGWNVERDDRC